MLVLFKYGKTRQSTICIGRCITNSNLKENYIVVALVSSDDSTLSFLLENPVDALLAVEISNREFLLVFNSKWKSFRVFDLTWHHMSNRIFWYSKIIHKNSILCFAALGIYVDSSGRRSRVHELMWPSQPVAASEYNILSWLKFVNKMNKTTLHGNGFQAVEQKNHLNFVTRNYNVFV